MNGTRIDLLNTPIGSKRTYILDTTFTRTMYILRIHFVYYRVYSGKQRF